MKKLLYIMILFVAAFFTVSCQKKDSALFEKFWSNTQDKIENASSLHIDESADISIRNIKTNVPQETNIKIGMDLQKDPFVLAMTNSSDTGAESVNYITKEDGNYYLYEPYKTIYFKSKLVSSNDYLIKPSELILPVKSSDVNQGDVYTEKGIRYIDFTDSLKYGDLANSTSLLSNVVDSFNNIDVDKLNQATIYLTFVYNYDTKELQKVQFNLQSMISTLLQNNDSMKVDTCSFTISFNNLNNVTVNSNFMDHSVTDAPAILDTSDPVITVGSKIYGRFEDTTDEDVYKVIIDKSGKYIFNTDYPFSLNTDLYNSNGALIDHENQNFAYNLSQGTYYLKIGNTSLVEGTRTYSVKITEAAFDDYADSVDNHSYPIGNLDGNTKITGALDYAGDKDFFSLPYPADLTLRFSTQENMRVYFMIKGSYHDPIASGTSLTIHLDDDSGPAYLYIYSDSGDIGDYTLDYTLTKLKPYVDDPDEIGPDVREIQPQTWIQAKKDNPNDWDMFKFTINEESVYRFELQSSYQETGDFMLYSEDGMLLGEENGYYFTPNLKPGTYYIKVKMNQDLVKYALYFKDIGSQIRDTSVTLTDDLTVIDGHTTFTGEIVRYHFTIDQNTYMNVMAYKNDNIQLKILDSEGHLLADENSFTSLFVPGDYTAEVTTLDCQDLSEGYKLGFLKISSVSDDYPSSPGFGDNYLGIFDPNASNTVHFDTNNDIDTYILNITTEGDFEFQSDVPVDITLIDAANTKTSVSTDTTIHLVSGKYYLEFEGSDTLANLSLIHK